MTSEYLFTELAPAPSEDQVVSEQTRRNIGHLIARVESVRTRHPLHAESYAVMLGNMLTTPPLTPRGSLELLVFAPRRPRYNGGNAPKRPSPFRRLWRMLRG
jgi:hypothetical protein